MYKVGEKEYTFDELVDTLITKPTPELTKCLHFIYLNDEKYKNLDIANMILYRQTLKDDRIESFEDYVDFFDNYSTLDNYNKNIYLKVLYSKLILDKTWDSPYLFEYPQYKAQFEGYKKKLNTIKIPVEAPIDCEEIPARKFDGSILPGYEKKWRSRTIKNREKAKKLTEKYERLKAEKILLKNIKKYGDVYSVEQLAFLYERMARKEDALKYFEIAKDYGFPESCKQYYLLSKSKKFNEILELADQNKGTKEELEYLYKAFKVDHLANNIALRIAKILLEPGTKCTNAELGKQYLDFQLDKTIVVEKSDRCDELFGYYAKLLYTGTMIRQDKVLAYFCYTCVKNKDEN